jgi:hypothetical protein
MPQNRQAWTEHIASRFMKSEAKPAKLKPAKLKLAKLKPGMPASFQALGRLPVGKMNKSEQKYAAHLDQLKLVGEVLWYGFECIKFRLAENTFYEPDFLVLTGERELQVHEFKGFWTDDARVKIKVAATLYPVFVFLAFRVRAKKDGGGYAREEF